MMHGKVVLAALAVAAIAALSCAADEEDAATATFGGFRLDTRKQLFALTTRADVDALWPVTYRAGETVAAFAPGGGETALVASPAAADGTVAFAPTAGGIWRLANSSGETAYMGVSWGVFGDAAAQPEATAESGALALHTVGDGPNRKCRDRRAAPPVAYTGDGWRGDAAAKSTLTFTAPDGTVTTRPKTGTGTEPFTFGKSGAWTVTLAMADGTTLEATITLANGLSVVIR